MPERRLKQFAIPGRLMALEGMTLGLLDDLLKRYGFVPHEAVCTQRFISATQDAWVLRYQHSSFPLLADFALIDTVEIDPVELGEGDA